MILMNKAVLVLSILCVCFSCTPTRPRSCSYSINVQEIDCSTHAIVTNVKNRYISYNSTLFEYEFRVKNITSVDSSGRSTFQSSNDSVAIFCIPKNQLVYYRYDLSANHTLTDSVKHKTKDFIKISPENNSSDPVYIELGKIRIENLSDTIFNDIRYKVYTQPGIVKDVTGDVVIQLFFLSDTSLKTPFNINERYPNLFKKYCFAGVSFHLLNANRKLISIITDIRPLTDKQDVLCKAILNKLTP